MIDTHAHLDALDEPGAAVARAREAGVTRVITIGTGIDSCRAALAIAEAERRRLRGARDRPAPGGDRGGGARRRAARAARRPSGGRRGRDGPRLSLRRRDEGRAAPLFEAQLGARATSSGSRSSSTRARRTTTPQSILARARRHGRHALLLGAGAARGGLERGWYVSFAGNVTYPKAAELREAAAAVPADRILAETDSPYLVAAAAAGQAERAGARRPHGGRARRRPRRGRRRARGADRRQRDAPRSRLP